MTYQIQTGFATILSEADGIITTDNLTNFITNLPEPHYDGGKSATLRSTLYIKDIMDDANVQHTATALLSLQVRLLQN